MKFSRREIIKGILLGTSGAAGLPSLQAMAASLAERVPVTPLVWIKDGVSDQDHLALLGQQLPTFLDLVAVQWDLRDYGPVQPTGFVANQGPFSAAPILVMEAVPSRHGPGLQIAAKVRAVLPQAKAALLLGTEACFGGISTDRRDIADFVALCRQHKTPLIKLPGIPVPPHHLLGILNHLEYYGFPRLDGKRRPLLYYGETVCERCERRDDLETGRFAQEFGSAGCLLQLGCKGPITHNSCSAVRWNGGANWCVGAGGPCTGCAEPGFPDHGGVGLYGRLSGGMFGSQSALLQNLEALGMGTAALAAAGIGLHLIRRALTPEERRGVETGDKEDA
ncbi:MAG: hypothetical protein O7A08_15010 [SAR324 cluster bacterium]|nr:hypothetical protein [SAR324 cluster bacterium]MCZ6842799.1 hypothetical protein [SAR324 cluster bacterium]